MLVAGTRVRPWSYSSQVSGEPHSISRSLGCRVRFQCSCGKVFAPPNPLRFQSSCERGRLAGLRVEQVTLVSSSLALGMQPYLKIYIFFLYKKSSENSKSILFNLYDFSLSSLG